MRQRFFWYNAAIEAILDGLNVFFGAVVLSAVVLWFFILFSSLLLLCPCLFRPDSSIIAFFSFVVFVVASPL